jgi:hypothetical protein
MISPSLAEQRAPKARGDEVSPILDFIIREMVINAASPSADRIREYNVMARQDCEAEFEKLPSWARIFGGVDFLEACQQGKVSARHLARGEWAWLSREGGPWDHRRYIRETFKPAQPEAQEQRSHHYNGFLYLHDLWSLIHYGFVGKACGFMESELLEGSPERDSFRLSRFEEASDRGAIAIGIKLYPFVPTISGILAAIQSMPGLARQPLGG